MNKQLLKILSLAAFASVTLVTSNSFAGTKTVLELFTSQGCSSCPPADQLAHELNTEETLVLSFHVDYWDYLGWKDTNAKPEFSHRQRSYAVMRGDKSVYTPQTIINGQTHEIGSDKAGIQKASIDNGPLPIALELNTEGELITINLPEAQNIEQTVVWLVTYTKTVEVLIERGENTGETITYTNVVRDMRPLGEWSGKSVTTSIKKSDILTKDTDGLAVIIQATHDGVPEKILGAAALNTL